MPAPVAQRAGGERRGGQAPGRLRRWWRRRRHWTSLPRWPAAGGGRPPPTPSKTSVLQSFIISAATSVSADPSSCYSHTTNTPESRSVELVIVCCASLIFFLSTSDMWLHYISIHPVRRRRVLFGWLLYVAIIREIFLLGRPLLWLCRHK